MEVIAADVGLIGLQAPGDAESAQMKTVRIRWRETSEHERVVRVKADFDPEGLDLANDLASLDDDGFQGLERDGIEVDVVNDDPHAELFDPEPADW